MLEVVENKGRFCTIEGNFKGRMASAGIRRQGAGSVQNAEVGEPGGIGSIFIGYITTRVRSMSRNLLWF